MQFCICYFVLYKVFLGAAFIQKKNLKCNKLLAHRGLVGWDYQHMTAEIWIQGGRVDSPDLSLVQSSFVRSCCITALHHLCIVCELLIIIKYRTDVWSAKKKDRC